MPPLADDGAKRAQLKRLLKGLQRKRADDGVAVIGMSGRYPQAETLDRFWENLAAGRDSVTEVPAERWRWQDHYDETPRKFGKTYARWGAFLSDVDAFDPLFFNIAPAEAEGMDPQQRLFLETAWQALEDAGATPRGLNQAGVRTGVFVGVMYGDYEWLGAQAALRGVETGAHVAYWSIANRVSYALDLQGPSMAVDTACSSSLTAIHLACESIRRGECEAAIAGGVNLILHPMHFSRLSGMLSTDGRCRSFGAGGNGFVGGEGVGALVLKSLSRAEQDGDRILAVIRGSALNAGGRTSGFTVPSPRAQSKAILAALEMAGLSARSLSYLEAHGTGTALGDPIEIGGLVSAFRQHTADTQFCAIGSVKSNIGHIEGAAGIAGITKVILQLQHGRLAPSLHAKTLNPALELEDSPFWIQRGDAPWPAAGPGQEPRRAGVSSFGGGGANAHVVIEEYRDRRPARGAAAGPALIVLSARTAPALRAYAQALADRIGDDQGLALDDVAFTLQCGREAMDERLAFVTPSLEAASETLRRFAAGETAEVYRGSARSGREAMATLLEGEAGETYLQALVAEARLDKLGQIWTQGFDAPWRTLHDQGARRPVSLPTYPFERKRYWIARPPEGSAARPSDPPAAPGAPTYRPVWARVGQAPPAPQAQGPVLTIAPDAAGALARQVALRAGGRLLWLRPGPDGRMAIWDEHGIAAAPDPTEADIVFLGGVRPGGAAATDQAAIAEGQGFGVLALLGLCGDLVRAGRRGVRLKIVANDVHDCFGAPAGNAQAASLFGFAQVLAAEQADWRIAAIDLAWPQDGAQDRIADLARAVLAEPWDRAGQPLAIRAGLRFERRLQALALPRPQPSALREGGIYLVIGGTGGVGRALTRGLIERYRARVVWVARRAPDAALLAEMETLNRQGGAVSFVAADATDAGALARAIAETKARHGALHGVVHSAMDLQTGLIGAADEAIFVAGSTVKIAGLSALAAATEAEPLDFIALFSSAGAFGGWAGTAAYTAAVAFEDALGRQMARERSTPVRIINWGYWGNVGAGARPGLKAMFDGFGVDSLSAGEGFDAVERILAGPERQLMPIRAKPAILRRMGLVEDRGVEVAADGLPPLLRQAAPALASLRPREDAVAPTWEGFDELDQIARLALLGVFQRMGVFRAAEEAHPRAALREALGVQAKFGPLFDALLAILIGDGVVIDDGDVLRTGPETPPDAAGVLAPSLQARKDRLLARSPDIEATIELIWILLADYPDVLRGTRNATDLMFPGSSMKLMQGLYKGNAITDWYNTLAARSVAACVAARLDRLPPGETLRILELGAGTGATTARVIEAVAADSARISYVYTDISAAFTEHGRRQFGARWDCFDFRVLNLELGLEEQGFAPAACDLVLATNVIHATRRLDRSLDVAKRLLKPGGWLVLNELTTLRAIVTIPGGVLDGWWLFEDGALRIPGSPLARPEIWSGLLAEAGFCEVAALGGHPVGGKILGQHVFVAESDGVLPAPADAPKAKAAASAAAPKAAETAEDGVARLEREIAAEVKAALQLDEAALDRPLADYGFDSLTGVKLVAALSERYAADITIDAFFEYPTIAALARHLAGRGIAAASAPVEAPARTTVMAGMGPTPLSAGQRALWEVAQLAPDSVAYNLPLAFVLPGGVDAEALRRSLERIWARHPALRVRVAAVGAAPLQTPHDGAPEFARRRLAGATAAAQQKEVRTQMRRPFDLAEGPLMRSILFERPDRPPILLITFHHIVFDGLSIQSFLEELQGFYAEETGGPAFRPPEPARDYAAFVAIERALLDGPEGERLRRYWSERLQGPIEGPRLPYDRARPLIPAFDGAHAGMTLDPQLMARLRALAASQGTTLFTVLLAAYQLLLHRIGGQDDIVVGAPMATRDPAFDGVLGYFINMVALRGDLSGDPGFSEMLRRTHATAREAIAHARYPFARIAEEFGHRAGGGANLLRAVFYFQNWVRPGGAAALPLEMLNGVHQEGEFDLTLEITDDGAACRLLLKYAPDLFNAATIARLGAQYRLVLEQAAATPRQPLSGFSLLDEAERHRALFAWNDTRTAYPGDGCVHALIGARALAAPEATAVRCDGAAMSYGELWRRSAVLAGRLAAMGIGPGARVGIMLPRGLDLPVALLAVLRAGAAYVPLDPAYPAEHLAYVCADAGLALAITDGAAPAPGVATLHPAAVQGDGQDGASTLPAVDSATAAYVIYTSGSTGQPKGVEIPHRALTNFILSMIETIGVSARDRLLALTTISFDIAGLELFAPLAAGGEVEVATQDMARDGIALAARLDAGDITMVQATPSAWQMALAGGWRGGTGLTALCGGEALDADLAEKLTARCAVAWNLYGPTETTIWSSAKRLAPGEAVTIGRPIANTELLVLDHHRQPAPVGATGELYIGGDGLALGYVGRPDLTAERFVEHPFAAGRRLYRTGDLVWRREDGELVYVGRNDQQMKIRGHRIEAGAIEAVLLGAPGVREAAVVLRRDGGHPQLVAFVVGAPGAALPDDAGWHALLAQRLAAHMVPARVLALDTLPLTLNRKLDRKRLAEAPLASLSAVAAAQPTAGTGRLTQELARLVAGIVGEEAAAIRADAHFGQYGMDSIRFTALARALGERFAIKVGPNLFYQHSTLARVAAYLTAEHGGSLTAYAEAPRAAALSAPAPAISAPARRSPAGAAEPVAVIGMAGMFPQCADLDAFWRALDAGRDLVTEIPPDRWDWRTAGAADPRARWGGFLPDVAAFDPQLFGISPREAEWMDPQQRLILQVVWSAIENAGRRPSDLAGSRTGVFMGVTNSDYGALVTARESIEGHTLTGVAHTLVANRLSFQFDLRGPSEVIDTACSSSLAAVRRGVEAIRQGHCDLALAGGVNVMLTPKIHGALAKANMLSPDGRCRAFDHRANGYVRGEGVGAVLLKRLDAALADGDPVLGLICGVAENHGGRTNSLTAPNPNAQAALIEAAHREAGFGPETVSYIETHGTGTALGDPIEIDGLKMAFAALGAGASVPVNCALGSVKTNIGHLEAAAGIAGLIKVLLAMRHGVIPALVHFEEQNPYLSLGGSGLVLDPARREWARMGRSPRRAGVSSFGFGGANAHVAIEEAPPAPQPAAATGPFLVVLSAKRPDRLTASAARLMAFAADPARVEADLAAIAWTSQLGREAMEERLAVVAEDLGALRRGLQAALSDEAQASVWRGASKRAAELADGVGEAMAEVMLQRRELAGLARLWVQGVGVDFSRLHDAPRRIAMPGYPFAEDRYWLPDEPVPASSATVASPAPAPMRRERLFHAADAALRDHRMGDRCILPATVYLDEACRAGARGEAVRAIRNLVWLRPAMATAGSSSTIAIETVLEPKDGGLAFEIRSSQGGVHAQGTLAYGAPAAVQGLDLAAVQSRCPDRMEGAEIYRRLAARDFHYGPAFQVLQTLDRDPARREVLGRLALPAQDELAGAALHPALMDGALQTVSGLLGEAEGLRLPFAAAEIALLGPLAGPCWVHAQALPEAGEGGAVRRFAVTIADDDGRPLVRIDRLALRSVETTAAAEGPIAIGYAWKPSEIETDNRPLGVVLLVTADAAVVRDFARSERPTRVVWLRPGEAFRAGDDGLTARPGSAEDLDAAAEWLKAAGALPDHVVIVAPPQADVAADLESGLFTAWALVRGLTRAGLAGGCTLLLLSQGERPALAGLGGFAAALAAENPRWRCRAAMLAGSGNVADLALAELGVDGQAGVAVRYDDGCRFVQAPALLAPGVRAAPAAPRRVVLITGGAGALGLIFARHFLASGARAIALCGRRPPDAAVLAQLRETGAQVAYYQADIADREATHRLLAEVRAAQGPIGGVVHAAGVLQDGLVLRQARGDVEKVLGPKLWGAVHLDEASVDDPLDFFALFSSTAARLGNQGQAAYGFANRFLAHFAAGRQAQVMAGRRRGASRAIDWGFWREGGMTLPPGALDAMSALYGMVPLDSTAGLAAFDAALAGEETEVLIAQGDAARLMAALNAGGPARLAAAPAARTLQPAIRPAVEAQLVALFARETKFPAETIDVEERLEAYGLDSVLAVQMSAGLEQAFGETPKTIFYEHRTLRDLADHLIASFPKQALAYAGLDTAVAVEAPAHETPDAPRPLAAMAASPAISPTYGQDIAVVGVSGRYPLAPDLEAFWENLADGRNCIVEVPSERWEPASATAGGKAPSRWGGFLTDVDRFDAALFQIPAQEAPWIDPQERLFLETVWALLEDAAVTPAQLAAQQKASGQGVGVFVGSMYQHYPFVPADAAAGALLAAASYWSIANRVSYFFNFQGPSLAVDSACSSSATAIHMACRSLLTGESCAAVAGGVNLSLHPSKYQALELKGVIDHQDHSASLGVGDGYTPGEGVGAVLLKRLEDALRDGDRIHGVIKGSAVNHSGRTHGFTVPSPHAQSDVILKAWRAADIDPRSLGYVEVAANGSALGDPIEIGALTRAFRSVSDARQVCPIGAVKSNIGHLEAASGVSQLTKVLLQLRHGVLAPSINADPPNPTLKLQDSPFFVQREAAAWPRPQGGLRRAGLSSFGAGGANVHMVVEEFVEAQGAPAHDGPLLFALSALTEDRLAASAAALARRLRSAGPDLRACDVAFTLQTGRQAMPARLAFIAQSHDEAVLRLEDFVAGGRVGLWTGQVGPSRRAAAMTGEAGLPALAEAWVKGAEIEWNSLYAAPPRRVGLPSYPFQRDRHWPGTSAVPAPMIAAPPSPPIARPGPEPSASPDPDAPQALQRRLAGMVAAGLGMSADDIDPDTQLGELGVDSLGFVTLADTLNQGFGLSLDPTVFFLHPTVNALAAFLVADHREAVAGPEPQAAPPPAMAQAAPVARLVAPAPVAPPSGQGLAPVAIVGIAGIFPGSPDLDAFWDHLEAGHDLITEVPGERWDWRAFAERNMPGKTAGRWGGFVPDVDRFDAGFFNISPREAAVMDPQQRLFLQTVWTAVENAGYAPQSLAGSSTGLFVGVSNFDYIETLREAGAALDGFAMIGNSHSILANRISFLLDLHGPSVAIDTACSSALIAINRAVRALQTGDCAMAVAGGVNLILHPNATIPMVASGMLSEDGRCKTFDASANGYVRGEGVGAMLLKPLSQAEQDGDHIYAVIRGTAQNHGGRTNSLTAPNPNAQAALLKAAWLEAGVSPSTAGYIEAHGTGTPLGDPIEVNGLKKAFAELYAHWRLPPPAEPHCAIGSVKTNIGHLESGSGAAGMLKVVLAMKHGVLPPSLHVTEQNPYIRLDQTPFFIARDRQDWPRLDDGAGGLLPRRAGVSSFGFGGANAHVVLEEYGRAPGEAAEGPLLLVLSARNAAGVTAYLEALAGLMRRRLAATDRDGLPPLADIAYTLQVGREAMSERVAMVAAAEPQLLAQIEALLRGETPSGAVRGSAGGPAPMDLGDEDGQVLIASWIRKGRLDRLAALWAAGGKVDWRALPGAAGRRRAPAPTYPFARDRHWPKAVAAAAPVPRGPMTWRGRIDADRDWVADHRVGGRRLMPAAVMLEMVRSAAAELKPGLRITGMRDIRLLRPLELMAGQGRDLRVVLQETADGLRFGFGPADEADNCAEGRIVSDAAAAPEPCDLAALAARCPDEIDGEAFYRGFAAAGYAYGPAFRPVTELWADPGRREALARLSRPASASQDWGAALHPSLVDGALQSVAGLLGGRMGGGGLDLPYAIDSLDLFAPLPTKCHAHVVPAATPRAFDVTLLDDAGVVLVAIRGYAFRSSRIAAPEDGDRLLAFTPRWEPASAPAPGGGDGPVLILAGDPPRPGRDWPRSWHLARPGKAFAVKGPRACELDFADREQQGRMLDWLAEAGALPRSVVHVAVGAAEDDFAAVTAFAQAVQARASWGPVGLVHVHEDGPGEGGAAMAAAAKCLAFELPRLSLTTLALAAPWPAPAAMIRAALDEAGPDAAQVRHRDGARWVRRYAPATLAATGAGLRQGGCYVVTGGLGGLGRVVAQDLARRYGARLVLCGRSAATETADALLAQLRAAGGDACYVQADITQAEGAERVLAEARRRFGAVNGVLHAAGVMRNAALARKAPQDMAAVLAPKLAGTRHLDQASAADRLDVFVTFSSVAAVLGGPGQIDYAYGNGFMDGFAASRQAMVEAGERFGRTISIDWPLWRDGGMTMTDQALAVMRQMTGMAPLSAADGLAALDAALGGEAGQLALAYGDPAKIRGVFMPQAAAAPAAPAPAADGTLVALTAALKAMVATATGHADAALDADQPLDAYGVDSLVIVELTPRLEVHFGELSKTLFFEHRTLRDLAIHLLDGHREAALRWLGHAPAAAPAAERVAAPGVVRAERAPQAATDLIAIVGMSGRYPLAPDLDAFWDNLREGRNCITEIPAERWDHAQHFDPRKGALGKSYSKWGGFIEAVDRFDAAFFGIPEDEARWIDPQERLFLETAWQAMEDAGFTRARIDALQKARRRGVGVYVGCMYQHYAQLAESRDLTSMLSTWSYWSIANRVSYTLNCSGPSLAVDTASSSSMVALHMACESIRRGESAMALAGGVNLSLHPGKYASLSQRGVIGGGDRSMSLGAGDGYMPGEGVGAVLLRPLADAVREGDPIRAVIRASSMNHAGRSLGYTSPNPQAQVEVISAALEQAGVGPDEIGWIEVAANGSPLGDAIEIASLGKVFAGAAGAWPIGAVKSNIGHLEAASGISQLTKAVLQLQHRTLAPSLNAAPSNPNIDLAATPFTVQTELAAWPAADDGPRRAIVNSFGLGGSNVCVVLEEYEAPPAPPVAGPGLVVLSAKTRQALGRYVARYIAFLDKSPHLPIPVIAYASQTGREAFGARLAVLAEDAAQLRASLEQWRAGRPDDCVWEGEARTNGHTPPGVIHAGPVSWPEVAQAWVVGAHAPWPDLTPEAIRRTISLPTYPFARERHWLTDPLPVKRAMAGEHLIDHALEIGSH